MAKDSQIEDTALAALARLLANPASRIMHGSKAAAGVFPGGSAAEKAAAKFCLENRWLEPTGEASGKGKVKKPLFRLSSAGVQAVLARGDPTQLLASLQKGVADLQAQTAGIVPQVQANLAGLLEEIKKSCEAALQPLAPLAKLGEIQKNLAQVLEKVKPANVEEILNKLSAAVPTAPPPRQHNAAWQEEVIRLAAQQKQTNPFQRLTLPQVYAHLKQTNPDLTLGQFHDGLRDLCQAKRIRLGPFSQALATLDDPRNALYLDREVKYYVELP